MAEAVVSCIVDRIGDLLVQQASFLVGVNDQVEDLRNELTWIQSFLEDADSRQDEGSVVQTWVSEIRDVAYDIEDIIDTYILKVVDEDENPTPRRRGILGSLKKYARIYEKGANLYTIGKEVEEVKTRIRRIGEAMQKHGIHRKDGGGRGGDMGRPSPQERFLQLRRSSPHDDGTLKDTIELDTKVEELVAKLENEEDFCRFITITGMGGIGKTTLAQKVYNCEKVKCHFQRCAWAYVSKDFNVKDVFKRLIKELKPNISIEELQVMELSSEEDLEKKLHELLKDYAYLVVLDDLWDLEAWESLKRAFPHNKSGRVILTSRKTKIAKESFIYQLRLLNETDSWKLFVVKAFGNDGCPTNLEASGKEMVKKCDGLPLAITVLAGLLRGKSPQEWFILGDHIDDLLMKEEGKNNVEKILSLSYNDLPHQLKPCFLYIGLFPEDFKIEAGQLIDSWVAEGFIRCERDYKTIEDVAEDYLNELIDRNMLQVRYQDELGKINSCQIHDLLRDICISKGQKEHSIDYSPRATSSSSSSSSSSSTMVTTYTSRRYAIHSGIGRYDFFNLSSNSHLRTLLLFNPDGESLQQRQLEFISKMRLLRVLDLSHVSLKGMRLPDAFGKLIHLRYLRLKNAKLPSSIESLRSLLSLNLSIVGDCRWSDIPIDALSKLTQLRHLYLNHAYWDGLDREVGFRLRIDTLTNLQSLLPVDAIVWEQNEMTNLINLRNLRIINMEASSDVELVLSSIAKLDRIQSLYLLFSGNPEHGFPTLLPLSHCRLLQALTLWGKIERLPEDPYHEFPPKLTKLELGRSMLGPEAMAILEKLPNLMYLALFQRSIMGRKIVCLAQGFPQLCYLSIESLETEEWEIKEGALPKLNFLRIFECRNLKKIPMGLRFVASIQVLHLGPVSNVLWDRFDRGEDAHEIGHISSVKTFRSFIIDPTSFKVTWVE